MVLRFRTCKEFLEEFLVLAVPLCLVMFLFPRMFPFSLITFWKMHGGLINYSKAVYPILLWAVILKACIYSIIAFDEKRAQKDLLIDNRSDYEIKVFLISLKAGIFEELVFRWVLFYWCIFILHLLNWL